MKKISCLFFWLHICYLVIFTLLAGFEKQSKDLQTWELPQKDIDYLYSVKNQQGKPYEYVVLPLTQNNVVTTYGDDLGYQGSYVNYYISNDKVLVPTYNDPNDAVAIALIQQLYPTRKAVGIDVRNLYADGGMIHCVTQQQPKK